MDILLFREQECAEVGDALYIPFIKHIDDLFDY